MSKGIKNEGLERCQLLAYEKWGKLIKFSAIQGMKKKFGTYEALQEYWKSLPKEIDNIVSYTFRATQNPVLVAHFEKVAYSNYVD